MHVELTRMITAWLGHATYGVNAMIPQVPRNKIGGGTDPEPPEVTIFNDVDFDVISETRTIIVPPITPSLVVASDVIVREDRGDAPNKSGIEIPNCQAVIGYYAEEGYREAALVAGDYTLRAVMLSMRQFHGTRANGFRELNGLRAARITRLEMERTLPDTKSTLLGLVAAQVLMLDKLP